MTAAVKTIVHPITGKTFKLGRRRPLVRPEFFFARAMLPTFPAAPPGPLGYPTKAVACLNQIYGNDILGDCTAAGAFHINGALLANAGEVVNFTESDVIAFYAGSCGYVPGNEATDQGGDEQTVLNYWKQNGLVSGLHKIDGWSGVDGSNAAEVRSATWLFENCYFGIELPDAWINPMPSISGFVWDVAGDPDPDNGHCFVGLDYTDQGVVIDSWGMLGTITWAAIAKYASIPLGGELYTVFGPDAINTATLKAPNGFNGAQLTSDLGGFA